MDTNPYLVAATLHRIYGMTIEHAFLAAWYVSHRQPPLLGYYDLIDRISRVTDDRLPGLTASELAILSNPHTWRRGPNPFRQRPEDPTYCRVCLRAKIHRRLRCVHCYRQLRAGDQEKTLGCLVLVAPGVRCGEPHVGCGRCRRHYQQAYRSQTLWQSAATVEDFTKRPSCDIISNRPRLLEGVV
jgi:hypothetical protein